MYGQSPRLHRTPGIFEILALNLKWNGSGHVRSDYACRSSTSFQSTDWSWSLPLGGLDVQKKGASETGENRLMLQREIISALTSKKKKAKK